MKTHLLAAISVSLLLTACGGSDSDSDTGTNTGTNAGGGTIVAADFTCPATIETDSAYADTFIPSSFTHSNGDAYGFGDANAGANRYWGSPKPTTDPIVAQTADFTVADIAAEFNAARAGDPTIKENLIMPTQTAWDSMDANDKGLYIVNSERCARGLRPLEASASIMINSASDYATNTLSADNLQTLPHGDIDAKMLAAGVVRTGTGINSDFLAQNESLAFQQAAGFPDQPTIKESQARSIYDWLYNDSGSMYLHRTHVLQKYSENSGSPTAAVEGLFGMATAINNDRAQGTTKIGQAWTVMHTFDPNGTFDMSTVTAAPAIFGPEKQGDCGSGTYTANTDATTGNNTSTCQ